MGPPSFSVIVYFCLWAFGALGSIVQISRYIDSLLHLPASTTVRQMGEGLFGEMTGHAVVALGVMLGANLLHQAILYFNLHEMEHKDEKWSKTFPNWYGSGPELTLRIAAFLLLLFSAGKAESIIDGVGLVNTAILNLDRKYFSIVFGSVCLFFILLVWDIFAVFRHDAGILKAVREKMLYLVTDFLAFLYWYVLNWGMMSRKLPSEGIMLIFLLVVVYVVAVFLRLWPAKIWPVGLHNLRRHSSEGENR